MLKCRSFCCEQDTEWNVTVIMRSSREMCGSPLGAGHPLVSLTGMLAECLDVFSDTFVQHRNMPDSTVAKLIVYSGLRAVQM
ncbi:hypothetical protein FKM82_004012 [Ascaphus truei]